MTSVPIPPESDAERERVLLEQLPRVRHIARRIHERLPRHVPFEDLVHAGVVGLIDAHNKFDHAKHVQFSSYAKFRIRGAILDSLRDLDWSPRELRRQGRLVESTHAQLSGKLGRVPTENELAREMGLELRELQSLLTDLHGLQLGSLHDESKPRGKEEEVLQNIPGSIEETPFLQCLHAEAKHLIEQAIAELPEKEQRVLTLYYYEELTMKEIGARLSVGESRVSQIHSLAIVHLRARLSFLTASNAGVPEQKPLCGTTTWVGLAAAKGPDKRALPETCGRSTDVGLQPSGGSDMNNSSTPPPAEGIANALIVCDDAVTIQQLDVAMQELALVQDLCAQIPAALVRLNRRKFDAVIVDLQLQGPVNTVLDRVRRSPSNRTAVLFAITDSEAETVGAFKAGSNFVLRRPLPLSSISKTLKVAYGLILRERRRYFRCPVKIAATICRAGLPNVQGETLNISENGMAINTSASLRPGLEVQVHFNLPDHASQFVVAAVICWCKEGRVGLQFTSLARDLAAELQEWLLRQLEESLPEPLADQFRRITDAPHARDAPPKYTG